MGPDRRFGSFGLCFGPNRRFSTHFGPNLMFLDRTGTLVNQDWTWAEAWADLVPATWADVGPSLGRGMGQPWADPGLILVRTWGRLLDDFWLFEANSD